MTDNRLDVSEAITHQLSLRSPKLAPRWKEGCALLEEPERWSLAADLTIRTLDHLFDKACSQQRLFLDTFIEALRLGEPRPVASFSKGLAVEPLTWDCADEAVQKQACEAIECALVRPAYWGGNKQAKLEAKELEMRWQCGRLADYLAASDLRDVRVYPALLDEEGKLRDSNANWYPITSPVPSPC